MRNCVLVSGDHDFVQMIFASGATRPCSRPAREVAAMPSAEVAALLLAAQSAGLSGLVPGFAWPPAPEGVFR
jgi:hypothetical protein